jgi:hypothetical protein
MYFAITVLVMCNTITHIMFDEHIRPFDWWMLGIEAAVLILIAYEVGVNVVRHHRAIKRQQELDGRVNRIMGFVSSGQALEHTVPPDGMPPLGSAGVAIQTAAAEWKSDVQSWIMDAHKFVGSCSPRASAKFLDDSRAASFRDTSIKYRPDTASHYETINRRLNNLQDIVQNPEAYL